MIFSKILKSLTNIKINLYLFYSISLKKKYHILPLQKPTQTKKKQLHQPTCASLPLQTNATACERHPDSGQRPPSDHLLRQPVIASAPAASRGSRHRESLSLKSSLPLPRPKLAEAGRLRRRPRRSRRSLTTSSFREPPLQSQRG